MNLLYSMLTLFICISIDKKGYALCVLDYDFMILDNAFLVHRPGVKLPKPDPQRDGMAKKQSDFIRSVISKELNIFFGQNSKCTL